MNLGRGRGEGEASEPVEGEGAEAEGVVEVESEKMEEGDGVGRGAEREVLDEVWLTEGVVGWEEEGTLLSSLLVMVGDEVGDL